MSHKPIPVSDELTEQFWEACGRGELRIQRCGSCQIYQHPPMTYCTSCLSVNMSYQLVTGLGRVYSYTETCSGARHPAFAAMTPYLIGIVELVEQEGLMMFTNFPGARLEQLAIDADVEVEFEQIAAGHVIPQFRLVVEN
jgi:uncharacterized protein